MSWYVQVAVTQWLDWVICKQQMLMAHGELTLGVKQPSIKVQDAQGLWGSEGFMSTWNKVKSSKRRKHQLRKCLPSSCCRWEQNQRPTAKQRDIGTHSSEWDISIKSLPSAQGGKRGERKGWGRGSPPGEQGPLCQPTLQSSDELTGWSSTGPTQGCTRLSAYIWWLSGSRFCEVPECVSGWVSDSRAFSWGSFYVSVCLTCKLLYDSFCFILLYFLCFVFTS